MAKTSKRVSIILLLGSLLIWFDLSFVSGTNDTKHDIHNQTQYQGPSAKSLAELAARGPLLRKIAGCAKVIHDMQNDQVPTNIEKPVFSVRQGKSESGFLSLQEDILTRGKSVARNLSPKTQRRRKQKSNWKRKFKKFWKWLKHVRKHRRQRNKENGTSAKKNERRKSERRRKKGRRKNKKNRKKKPENLASDPIREDDLSEEERTQILRNKELLKQTLLNLESITHV